MTCSIPVVFVLRLIPSMVQFALGERRMISLIDGAPREVLAQEEKATILSERQRVDSVTKLLAVRAGTDVGTHPAPDHITWVFRDFSMPRSIIARAPSTHSGSHRELAAPGWC